MMEFLKNIDKDSVTFWIALAALVSPGIVELIRGFFDRSRQKKEMELKRKQKCIANVITYLESVNDYLEIIDINFPSEIDDEKEKKKIISKNKSFRLKSIVLANFYEQNMWKQDIFESNSLDLYFSKLIDGKVSSPMINTIEIIQSFIDSTSDTDNYIELKTLIDILPRILSDYSFKEDTNFISRQTKDYIKNKRITYQNEKETSSDYTIKSKESVSEYYKRVFNKLEEIDKFDLNKLSGVSGRVSFSDNVSWREKEKIRFKNGKEIVLNVGIKKSEAQTLINGILLQQVIQNKQT
ncbi:hypothetical protein J1C81_02960 [Streptococcus sanguinis]|uniref:Uncharacterized protein n=1 Tax=Streptococcus sanguinis SK330 TaxID=888813 RepID=F2C4J9_STRSA|nr:hypothetical protein [Streptococcus sanguinis]EGF15844.1 hypothetical protein HMPREF9386_0014 [Streptococcus sanguinis SK330]